MNKIQTGIGKVVLAVILLLHIGCGSSSTGTVTGTVTASAGGDQDVLVGDTVTLDGLASVGVESSVWTLTTKPTGSSASLTNASQLQATFVPDEVGDYVATLSINGGDSTDTVTITAKSLVADISVPSDSNISTRERFGSTEFVVDLGEEGATISAVDSELADDASVASYAWEQIDGPSTTAESDTASETFTFTAPEKVDLLNEADSYKWQVLPVSRDDRKLTFRLTITDSDGNSDTATMDVYLEEDGAELHTSSGLTNVSKGETVHLAGPSLKAVANAASSAVTDWSWSISVPDGSSATFADSGTTTSSLQMPSFVPDVEGLYTVSYTSTSAAITTAQTLRISASDYVGVGTVGGTTAVSPQCGNCHDGSVQPDKLTGYQDTVHASVFENDIELYGTLGESPYLWEYHTVGYNTDADNGGFDDLVSDAVFTFPEDGMSFADFVSEEPDLAVLANVQCESCHGPGGEHNGSPTKIDSSVSVSGVCGQCHLQEDAWSNSGHNSTGVVHGSGSYQSSWLGAGCNRCHTGRGFVNYADALADGDDEATAISGLAAINSATETSTFVGVQCAACHDPHDATNDVQLRRAGEINMIIDDSTVDAGKAATCYTCHDGVYRFGTLSCDDNNDGTSEAICLTVDQIATGNSRQVHYNPQAPVLEGKGALTDLDGDGDDDFTLDENSFHTSDDFILSEVTGDETLSTTNDKCVTCHMSTGPSVDEEGYKHLGGHAFKLRSGHSIGHLAADDEDGEEESEAGDLELTSACQSCHLDVEDSFDREARADYDGDGSIEGIQSEVEGLLYALTTKIIAQDGGDVITTTSGTTLSNGEYTVDALSYTSTSSATKGWRIATDTIRRAVWNHNLIVRDASLGIHNAAFTIQVLQGTYTAVGGNSFATDYPNAATR